MPERTSSYLLLCYTMRVLVRTSCILLCSFRETVLNPTNTTTFLIKDSEGRRERYENDFACVFASLIPDEVIRLLNLPNPSSRTMALRSTQALTEMSTNNLLGGKGWPARKADNLTAICEPIV
jgi:hypothetical protein